MLRAASTLLLITFSAAAMSQVADLSAGKALTEANCYQCHGTEVYTRADRKVKTLEGLQRQVQRCELALGLKWFDEEIGNVSAYLNQEFYKLK